jgi:S-sulfosulfanyl-L-cysteine sulfohydrolase
MTGSQIKDVLEDICDNLFNTDPYCQQGGDMVRVGGLAYTCAPAERIGARISDLRLVGGRRLEAQKRYKVAGWASVNKQEGTPIWDLLANHLRSGGLSGTSTSGATLKGVDGNPGLAEQ